VVEEEEDIATPIIGEERLTMSVTLGNPDLPAVGACAGIEVECAALP
jgi:hypothetical protein